jgi:hypothetical protein
VLQFYTIDEDSLNLVLKTIQRSPSPNPPHACHHVPTSPRPFEPTLSPFSHPQNTLCETRKVSTRTSVPFLAQPHSQTHSWTLRN